MDYSHNNISPLDNRYQNKILELREVFSEHALIKTRFYIEIDWLIFLCSNYSKYFDSISKSSIIKLNKFKYNFSNKDVKKIKKANYYQEFFVFGTSMSVMMLNRCRKKCDYHASVIAIMT